MDDLTDAAIAHGGAIGDMLAAAWASPPRNLTPTTRDAWQFECLGVGYTAIKDREAELRAAGASEDQAALYRMAALAAVVARIRLGDVTGAAAGTAN